MYNIHICNIIHSICLYIIIYLLNTYMKNLTLYNLMCLENMIISLPIEKLRYTILLFHYVIGICNT